MAQRCDDRSGQSCQWFQQRYALTQRSGWSVGASQTGIIDNGDPQLHATLWMARRIVDLGVVRGGSDSFATSINNAGQVVGVSNNGVADPFSPFGVQVRTFLWEEGE